MWHAELGMQQQHYQHSYDDILMVGTDGHDHVHNTAGAGSKRPERRRSSRTRHSAVSAGELDRKVDCCSASRSLVDCLSDVLGTRDWGFRRAGSFGSTDGREGCVGEERAGIYITVKDLECVDDGVVFVATLEGLWGFQAPLDDCHMANG